MTTGARDPRVGSRRRWVLVGLVVAFFAWIFVSGVVLWGARQRTNDGLDALERARATISDTGLLRGDVQGPLRTAKHAFEDAHSLADGPVVAPLKIVPFLGGNVRSVGALTAAAERVTAVAEATANRAHELLRQHPTTGPERLEMLRSVADTTRRAERSLRRIDLGPDFFLVGPLGDARQQFADRLSELRGSLADASAAAEGVERLMRGPRRYLVLAANNAEMRSGSGMMLSAGVATFENGEFSLGDMRPSSDFNLAPGTVALPADLQRLWGFTPIGVDWRWLATTPRFEVTGRLAADMWEAAMGEHVDGVLAVDPVAVRALLDAQGPIEVDGRRITADDVVEYLLYDQYAVADVDPGQAERRDQLSAVARTALDALSTRSWNPDGLVESLADAGRGRHVLAWSRDPVEQQAWQGGGIGGGQRPDSLALAILNTGGNKLDPFLKVQASLDVAPRPDGGHDVTVRLRLRNDAPSGLPRYVAGPHSDTDLVAGEYQGIVTANTPGLGSLPRLTGPPVLVAGWDGPTKVVGAGSLRLQQGQSTTIAVRFAVPAALDHLVIEPSARVPAISWRYGRQRWDDLGPHSVDLG
jgi:hypothetical protein